MVEKAVNFGTDDIEPDVDYYRFIKNCEIVDDCMLVYKYKGYEIVYCKKDEEKVKHDGNDSDGSSSDVEIIDSASVYKKDNDGDDSNGCAEYRRRVLRVLNEPYDHNEYCRLFEEINVYFKTFPDLKRKLSKNRYWPGKRLPILRGFFYWLQKNPHEGTFKPWKDAECLSVNLTTSNA